ncbi:MAG: DegV family protein [Actinomycetia bacterium]|nr:DegV family protein [Actinomycetes bacterium]
MVRVVTDSAADLPADVRRAHGVWSVPLTVFFGEEAYLDQEDLDADGFLARLTTSPTLPTTAAPSPAAFAGRYRAARDQGATGVVSIHLSGALSATVRNAEAGRREAGWDGVRVVDGRSASLGTGLLVLWAARAARAGLDADAVAAGVDRLADRLRVGFSVATLEYLARGGRIGQAARLLGGWLDVRPILALANGSVHPVRRVRGPRQVAGALVDALGDVPAGPAVAAVAHSGDAEGIERGRQVLAALAARGVEWQDTVFGRIGPVIGVHAGPGALGVIVLPLDAASLALWTAGAPGPGGEEDDTR